MSTFIQPLERRTLFAVTGATLGADLSTVNADARAVRSGFTAVRATMSADVKTVAADLKGLSNKSQNNKLMATLRADTAKSLAKVAVAQERYLASGQALSTVVTVEARLLSSHTTNTALRSRVAANATKLTSTVATNLAALQTAVTTAVGTYDTDLVAIATADPSAASATGAAQADVATSTPTTTTAKYLGSANQFKVDASVLATDASSV